MQVHDLGSLWVESDGLPVAVNGKRLVSALSILLVNLNEKVRTDVLIESVWGRAPSPRAPAALDTLMWRLRRVLDPDRGARISSTLLRTEDHGYRLTMPVDAVDSWQFEELASTIAKSRDPSATAALTESALGLWRGRPYDDVDDHGWLDPHRARLGETRLSIAQARIGALLDTGKPEQAVAEIVPLITEHPLVERLWYYRILGLYQSGRVGAALDAYAQIRRVLDAELGMPPGPDLRKLHQDVLTHDAVLAGPPQVQPTRGTVRIPRHRTTLVGREAEVSAVDDLVRRHRLVSITGTTGAGKTRLAAAVAERAKTRFPDGVCFVELSDLSDVADLSTLAARVQQTLGVEADAAGPSTHAVVDYLAARAMLIIIDNCEQVSGAVAELAAAVLEQDGPSRLLITSRRVLGADEEVVHRLHPLDPPASSSAADLRDSAAVALFVDRAARHGIAIDLDGPDGAEVARICRAVDGLPLEIELAAARARTFELHEIADNVSAHPMSLGPSTGQRRRPGEVTLRESIDSSYETLTEHERIAHARLSALPPRFTLEAAVAACAGPWLPADLVPNALIGLVGQSLLEATRPERPNGPSLFRQLVPIRAHAAQQLSAESAIVDQALLQWISVIAGTGPRIGQSDGGALDRRLEDNRRTITAVLERAVAEGPGDDVLITLCRLVPYWWLGGKLGPETLRLMSAASAAVGPKNTDFAAACAIAAHAAFLTIHQPGTARAGVLLDSITRVGEAPPELAIFAGELLLSVAAACWVGGDLVAAEAAADGVAAYGERLDDDHLRVLARSVRAAIGLAIDPPAAARAAQLALDESQRLGNCSAAIMCLHTLYMAALIAQDGPSGLAWTEAAIRLQLQIGQRNAATTLEARGSLYLIASRPRDAARCYGSASLQYSRIGRSWPALPGTEESITVARDQLGGDEFEQAWASGERLGASDLVDAWL